MRYTLNANSIKKDTIIRTILLAVALVNQILVSTGHSIIPLDNEALTEFISLALTIAASVWAWWKNNSFTVAARKADQVLTEEKKKNKD